MSSFALNLEKTDRNNAIYEAYQAGAPLTSLAVDHGIASQTVWTILTRIAERRGEKLRDGRTLWRPQARKVSERNLQIYRDWLDGESKYMLAKDYRISIARVYQILKRMRRKHEAGELRKQLAG